MAKSSNRGGGEGTHDRGGVRTTLTPAFGANPSKGTQQNMNGPFNAPRAGSDMLPTHVYDKTGGPKAGPKANSRDVPGTILTNPRGPRR